MARKKPKKPKKKDMTVNITDNLTEIDAVNAANEAGWTPTSSSDFVGFQRAGGRCYGDQASQGIFNQFFTDSALADFSNRTIFGWMRSGNPDIEANDGFGIILGDRNQEVATQTVNAIGSGYVALDILTVVGGVGAAATILVDTVDGGGGILTSSIDGAGNYTTLPPTPNSVSGGTGSGATFDLTFQDASAVGIRTSYTVGGSDNYGHFVLGWSGFRLDTASLPSNFLDIVGTAPPDITRILDIGYAIDYQTKALGNADNIFFDRLTYIANGSPALTVAGGTTGARGTFAEIVTDDLDLLNAYGILRELVGAKAYELFFGIDFGDVGTASTFFEDSDFQLFINGLGSGDGGMSVGNMDIAVLANSTGTNVWNISDFLVQGVGTVASLDFSEANIDELKIERGTFTDLGTMLLPPQDVGQKFLADIVFNNCGQVVPDTCDMDRIVFNGATDANGALLLDEATHSNMTGLTFVSDGAGHAIELTPVGAGPFSFTWDNWKFSGYGADDTTDAVVVVDNALDADVTITVSNGGDSPTVTKAAGYTGTVTIVAGAVTVEINVKNELGANLQNARVFLETAETIGGGEIFEAAVTSITQAAGVATVTMAAAHGLETGDLIVVRGAQPDGYNKVETATVTSTTVFTYPVNSGLSSPATGTPIVSYVAIHELTDASGNANVTRPFGADQNFTGWARLKNTSSPFYKDADLAIGVDSTNGNNVNAVLLDDE